jgi:hypothetical protein
MAAATGDGQGEGKRQRRGSRAELQVEIVKCFDGRRRKEKRSRGGRPHPGSEIGKVESRCEVEGFDNRTRLASMRESGFVAISHLLGKYSNNNCSIYPVALLFSRLSVSASVLPASAIKSA